MANETVQNLVVTITIKGQVISVDGGKQDVNIFKEIAFTDGTSSNQLSQWYYDETRALAATNEDIDVSGSATYTDFKGTALAMAGVRIIYAENLDTDTGDTLTVKQPAANGVPGIMVAAGDGVTVQPGGVFLWIAPGVDLATVTAGTGDLINFATADTSNYKLFIGGT